MKNLVLSFFLIILVQSTMAQSLLTENFENYQGFGDPLTGGWTTSTSGFRVYIRTVPGSSNIKICEVNLSPNKKGDSLMTPTFGPLSANATLSFKSRLIDSYIGSSATFNHVPAAGDVVSAFISTDGVNYQFLQDLLPSYPTGNDLNFTNFTLPINGFEGNNVKVKFRTTRTAGSWYPSFDDFSASNVTGTRELKTFGDFEVIPNPSTGSVAIIAPNFSDNARVEIFNILGNRVLQTNLTANRVQLNLSELKSGIYLVKVSEGKFSAVKRLILK